MDYVDRCGNRAFGQFGRRRFGVDSKETHRGHEKTTNGSRRMGEERSWKL